MVGYCVLLLEKWLYKSSRSDYNNIVLASLFVALVSLWYPLNVLSLLLAIAGLIATLVDGGLFKGGRVMKKTYLVSLGICEVETAQGCDPWKREISDNQRVG